MTLLVEAPATNEPERRYLLDLVLTDLLGLSWRLHLGPRSDVRLSVDGDARTRDVVLLDVLFSIRPRDWLTPASLPREPVS